jgi:hypothetical protein
LMDSERIMVECGCGYGADSDRKRILDKYTQKMRNMILLYSIK